jgi:oligopeptide transport system substrate-binding protein
MEPVCFKALRCTFASSLLAAALLPGLSHAQTPPLHATQELVRSNNTEPESLDPALSETVYSTIIVCDLFEGLTAIDRDGKVVPGVAQSWKQTNPTTWVFTLRKNSVFSNGDPVTAQDFVYAWQRFLDPKTASPYANTFGMYLVNGADVAAGKKPPAELGVRALNANTLEVKTAIPVPFMLNLVAGQQFAPVSRAVIEKFGRDWTKPSHMVSNGPFVLQEAIVNSKIVLTKNPRYWDAAAVKLTKVTYLPIEDGNADLSLYKSGQTDMLYQTPPGSYAALQAAYPKEIRNTPLLAIRYYALNTKDPLMKDVRVRKALSMVLDRDILAQKVTADGQIPLYGLMVQGTQGATVGNYDWTSWPMARRVEEAKKLLAQAGVKPGTKVTLMYNTSDYHKKMAIFAASEWKTKLGLEVEMETLELKVMVKRLHDQAYQIGRYGWTVDYNDATSFLSIVQCDSEQNMTAGCNRAADALAEQGNQQTDPAKRSALLSRAANLAMEDYPLIPLLQRTMPRLVKTYVGGYSESNALDRIRSKDLFILKH